MRARSTDVEAIELNLSCPNVDEAPESAAEIVAACRAATALPLYAKLSPAHWDIAEVARAVAGGRRRRALARQHDPRPRARRATLRPGARARRRRLSGPGAKPVALAAVYACLRGDRAADRRAWAASRPGATRSSSRLPARAHVALGTVLFADPAAPARIRAELAAELAALGLSST